MATDFMATSRMKNIRLFITNDLRQPINWIQVNEDGTEEHGSSMLHDLDGVEDASFEVYLSANCCSIIKTNVSGISTKRLTEELLLGLIEENLVDEIDEVKAVVLRTEDDIAYIAVFDREFYSELFNYVLNANVKFIQSFVYATAYHDNSWTLYLSNNQRFLRTSLYEYFTLDDEKPLPLLLIDMLANQKPENMTVYTDDETYSHLSSLALQHGITLDRQSENLDYGVLVWNFYKQKSTRFRLKLNDVARTQLTRVLNSFKFLSISLIAIWLISITLLNINTYSLGSQIKENLKGILNLQELNKTSIIEANKKLTNLRHKRGMYSDNDAMILMEDFLEVVSTASTEDIKQVIYQGNTLKIMLGSNFNSSQMKGYIDIFVTKRITATIEDYKTYMKENKSAGKGTNSILDAENKTDMAPEAQWVVTLKPLSVDNDLKMVNK